MTLFKPLPRLITRPISLAVLLGWAGVMAILINRSYMQASSANLATDLARYGSTAVWRGVYYRGDKIGFTVSQTVRTDDGYELNEDGRLQMSLLGATTAATIHTTARVDGSFALRSFEFSLDPGTGAIQVRGRVEAVGPAGQNDGPARRLTIGITSRSGTRTEVRDLAEPPVLSQNLSRLLANGGLESGRRHKWTILDPATLTSAPVVLNVRKREIVRVGESVVPAFRVDMEFAGLSTTSWVTDTGEVVREESPLGLVTVREPADRARAMAVPLRVRDDLLKAAAVVPRMQPRGMSAFFEPRDVRRLVLRLEGADLSRLDLDGVGQAAHGNSIEIGDLQTRSAGDPDPDARRYLASEPLIESDAPEIRAEADRALQMISGPRERAERLTRYVNALLEKKPTISLPSAREVLRTRVGDCNEHTALYVAMARAAGIPARVAVGLVYVHGAFYYHAWPEVYLDEPPGRGMWLAVDPTLNQFPADSTHVRLARGGLEKQTVILPLVGRLKMTIVELELAPGTTPILVGRQPTDLGPLAIAIPRRQSGGCWSRSPR